MSRPQALPILTGYEALPVCIHEQILSYLPPKDGFKLRMLSRTFSTVMADQNIRSVAVRHYGHNVARGLVENGSDNFINHYLGRPTSSKRIILQKFKNDVCHAEAEVKLCGKYAMVCFINRNLLDIQVYDLQTGDIDTWQVNSISLRRGRRVEDLFLSDDVIGVRIDRELLWCKRDTDRWIRTPLANDVSKVILVGSRFYALKTNSRTPLTFFRSIWCLDTNTRRSSWDRFFIDLGVNVTQPIAWILYIGEGYTDVFLFAEDASGYKAVIVNRFSPRGNSRWTFGLGRHQRYFTDFRGDLTTAQLDLEVIPATNPEEYYLCFWRRSNRNTFPTRQPQDRFVVLFQLRERNIFPMLPISFGYGDNVYNWREDRISLSCVRRRQHGRLYAYQSRLRWNERPSHDLYKQAIVANEDYMVCLVAERPGSIHLRVFAFDGTPSLNPRIPGNPPTSWDVVESDRDD